MNITENIIGEQFFYITEKFRNLKSSLKKR